jgi:hypothetical protein
MTIRRLLLLPAVLALAFGAYNFFSFITETQRLGGDALNGYVRDGHYYVTNHGQAREVTREEWEHCRTHSLSVFVSHPLAMLGMAYVLFAFVFPSLMGRAQAATPQRVEAVRTSGPELASTSCSAKIGSVNIRVRATVHPGGIVVKPMLIGPRAVLAREMRNLQPKSSFLLRGIALEHAAPDLASPLVLWVGRDASVESALRRLMPWSGSH